MNFPYGHYTLGMLQDGLTLATAILIDKILRNRGLLRSHLLAGMCPNYVTC